MTTLISSGANVNKTDASGRSALTLGNFKNSYKNKHILNLKYLFNKCSDNNLSN